MERECEYCGRKIPKARLEVLPNTTTCVKCSKERQNIGIISTDAHGDSIDIQIAKPVYDEESNSQYKKKRKQYRDDED